MGLLDLPHDPLDREWSEVLAKSATVRIERIVSRGQHSPEGFWYDQDEDEWVAVLAGEAVVRLTDRSVALAPGDTLFLPAHCRHRVEHTGSQPPCVWLCVFGPLSSKEDD